VRRGSYEEQEAKEQESRINQSRRENHPFFSLLSVFPLPLNSVCLHVFLSEKSSNIMVFFCVSSNVSASFFPSSRDFRTTPAGSGCVFALPLSNIFDF
jgi:hypothetical protein